jgi:hypothetical protein
MRRRERRHVAEPVAGTCPHSNSHSHADADADADPNAHSNADAHTDADPNTGRRDHVYDYIVGSVTEEPDGRGRHARDVRQQRQSIA